MRYRGDPKLEFTPEGKLLITSLLVKSGIITGGIYEEKSSDASSLSLSHKYIHEIPSNLGEYEDLVFDYEKIAVDNSPSSPYYRNIYLSVNAFKKEGSDYYGTGFVIIHPNGQIEEGFLPLIGSQIGVPSSLLVGPGGEIYAISDNAGGKIAVSLDGGKTFNNFIRSVPHEQRTFTAHPFLVSTGFPYSDHLPT